MESYDRDLHTHGIESYEQKANKSRRGLPFGLVLGVFIGSIIGLFLAPKSGQSLRDDLKDPKGMLDEQKDKITDKVTEKKAELEEVKRIKETDDDEIAAQRRAIKEEAREHRDSIDLSKL